MRIPIGLVRPIVHVAETYFVDTSPPEREGARADVLACLFNAAPITGWRNYPGSTRTIDLKADPEQIFSAFSRSNRNNIKLAGSRDDTETKIHFDVTADELDRFSHYYDEFAASKGVPAVSRPQLRALASTGMLVLSMAHASDGSILAAHAYILHHGRARLTHSASLFRLEQDKSERGRIGRANRVLHWNDMLAFRDVEATSYDLGGWYGGTRDEALLRINAFKREFGGEIVPEWNSFLPLSTSGTVYLAVRHLVRRMRG